MTVETIYPKTLPTQHIIPTNVPFCLPIESSTFDEKNRYVKGITSSVGHSGTPQEKDALWYNSLYSGHHGLHHQVGIPVDFSRKSLYSCYGVSHIVPEVATVSKFHGLTASATTLKPIKSDESEEIVIVPLRDLPHEEAKNEISKYVQLDGGRKVYISELAEKLRLDIELIMDIMEELENETRE
ncbi:MAG: hypothetical protein Q7J10_06005 [Methanosarcinaceae archaeon]|nr:hypothetical protein [Methanosarcinaceae archaeon]